jgi:hypothetical protein
MSLDINQPTMVASYIKKLASSLEIQKNSVKNMNLEAKKSLKSLK